MSQQPNSIVNGPSTGYNTTIKDEIINKDMQHPSTPQTMGPITNPERSLKRADSRSSIQPGNTQDEYVFQPATPQQPQQNPYSPQQMGFADSLKTLKRTDSRSSMQSEHIQDEYAQQQEYSILQPAGVVNPQRPLKRVDSRSSFQMTNGQYDNAAYIQPQQQSVKPINPQRPFMRSESRSCFQMENIQDERSQQISSQVYRQPPPCRSPISQRPLMRTESRSFIQMGNENLQDENGQQLPSPQHFQSSPPNRPVNFQRPLLRTDSRIFIQMENVQDERRHLLQSQSPHTFQPTRPINPQRPLMRTDSRSYFQLSVPQSGEGYQQSYRPVNPQRPLTRFDSSVFQMAHPQQNENGPQQQIFHSAQSVGPVNQARPLTRIDSRSSLQFRPPFPNQPGSPLRPASVRQPQPQQQPQQFVQRSPVPGQRPPGPQSPLPQPPFPQNQNRANFRPPAPFPRTPVPNQRPPGLLHQKSVPAFPIIRPQIPEEGANRSQTLDTTEIEYSKGPDDNKDANEHTKTSSGAAINNRSYSLNMNPPESPNESADDQRRRSASNVYGLREGRPSSVQSSHSDSVESLDKKQENEVPSRPESRSASRMNKIVEDEGKHRNSLTNESHKSPDMSNESPGEKSQPTVSDTPDSTNSNNVQSEPQAVVIQPPSPKSPIPKPAHKSPTPKPSSHGNAPIQNGTEKITSENTRQNATKPSENIKEGPKKPDKLLNLDKPTKAKSPARSEGDNDSGVDESTQGNDPSSNGENRSPRKASKSRNSSTTPTGRSLSRGSKSPSLKSPDSNVTTPGSASEKKKVPMNKVQVGSAPSPNLKVVRSKIGSLENASYKPGGGKVKIETKKLDFKTAGPRIEAKNDKYIPKGGEKKIVQQKLQWNAKSKIGSLENTTYKPKGGDKKIETVKLDFKEKAKPKVGSKDNIKHQPGGGDIKSQEIVDEKASANEKNKAVISCGKIENKKLDVKANSKIGSLDNVKYKPGGGEKKIFDDKDYLKQKSAVSSIDHSLSGSQNSLPSQPDTKAPVADENLNQEH